MNEDMSEYLEEKRVKDLVKKKVSTLCTTRPSRISSGSFAIGLSIGDNDDAGADDDMDDLPLLDGDDNNEESAMEQVD
jgi:hypothetical protein